MHVRGKNEDFYVQSLNFKHFRSFKMKILTFSIIFALSNASEFQAISQRDKLWAKLENYGRITGLSDEKILSIWEKSLNMQTDSNQGFK